MAATPLQTVVGSGQNLNTLSVSIPAPVQQTSRVVVGVAWQDATTSLPDAPALVQLGDARMHLIGSPVIGASPGFVKAAQWYLDGSELSGTGETLLTIQYSADTTQQFTAITVIAAEFSDVVPGLSPDTSASNTATSSFTSVPTLTITGPSDLVVGFVATSNGSAEAFTPFAGDPYNVLAFDGAGNNLRVALQWSIEGAGSTAVPLTMSPSHTWVKQATAFFTLAVVPQGVFILDAPGQTSPINRQLAFQQWAPFTAPVPAPPGIPGAIFRPDPPGQTAPAGRMTAFQQWVPFSLAANPFVIDTATLFSPAMLYKDSSGTWHTAMRCQVGGAGIASMLAQGQVLTAGTSQAGSDTAATAYAAAKSAVGTSAGMVFPADTFTDPFSSTS